MSVLTIYLLSVIVFVVLFRLLHVWRSCHSSMTWFSGVLQMVSNERISDEEKERAARAAALGLGKDSLILLSKLVVLALVTPLPALLADRFGIFVFSQLLVFALRPDVMLLTIAGSYVIYRAIQVGHSARRGHSGE